MTKILLFPGLAHKPADNYQCGCDNDPESPSAKLQLHLLPARQLLLHRIGNLYRVRAADVQGVMHQPVTVDVAVAVHSHRVATVMHIDAVPLVDAVPL